MGSLESLVLTVIVGGIIGWLAGIVMKTHGQMTVLADIVVGIVGSWLGYFAFGLLGLVAYGPLGEFIVRVVGAILLLAILKGLKVYR
jgi:uncharacterized membrane protein YeaQ/YmgE (transglycosylase-associated protein family)